MTSTPPPVKSAEDAAREWLRAHVMDMGDCEDALVNSLARAFATRDASIRAEERRAVIEQVIALNIAWGRPFTRAEAIRALASPPSQGEG